MVSMHVFLIGISIKNKVFGVIELKKMADKKGSIC